MGAGGAEAVVGTLARELLVSGAVVTVASNGGWRTNELSAAGARLVGIRLQGRNPARLLTAAATLGREFRRHPPALIHSHNVKAALFERLRLFQHLIRLSNAGRIPEEDLQFSTFAHDVPRESGPCSLIRLASAIFYPRSAA